MFGGGGGKNSGNTLIFSSRLVVASLRHHCDTIWSIRGEHHNLRTHLVAGFVNLVSRGQKLFKYHRVISTVWVVIQWYHHFLILLFIFIQLCHKKKYIWVISRWSCWIWQWSIFILKRDCQNSHKSTSNSEPSVLHICSKNWGFLSQEQGLND